MKNFVKENWYKLMMGSSMMMASFGFMIYAISPAYSNNNDHKVEISSSQTTTSPVGTNGVIVGDKAYFVDGGYAYICGTGAIDEFFGYSKGKKQWAGSEFCYDFVGASGTKYREVHGKKVKLP